MKTCIINILLCFLLLPARAADNYALNDTLYVWARNGLNLREQPDLKGKVIKTLEPGARVIVREITEKKLTLNSGADTSELIKEPYLLRGEWILVEIDSGRKGYLFDVYLLKFHTPSESAYKIQEYLLEIRKEELSIDTIWNPEGIERYESDSEIYTVKINSNNGIRSSVTYNSALGLRISEIDGFSIEEGFIFYMFFNPDKDPFSEGDNPRLLKNWADELYIGISICDIRFHLKGKTLFIEERCSC